MYNDYVIEAIDDMQWKLSVKQYGVTEQGNPQPDKLIGYYGYFDQLCNKIIRLEALAKTNKASDVEDVKLAIENVSESLHKAFHKRPNEVVADGIV